MPVSPNFQFKPASRQIDLSTIIGLSAILILIGLTLAWNGQFTSFLDAPSFFIVVGGTAAITIMATTWQDLQNTWSVLKSTFASMQVEPHEYSRQLLDLAMVARQKGLIQLQSYDKSMRSDSFLRQSMRLLSDGIKPEEISALLKQEIDSVVHRQEQAVRVLRRAADIAPAMGLIGTLIGLVQMLGNLEDPSTIGPSMALALLTTFYGAFLSTAVLTPLATKLEKRTDEDLTQKILTLSAATSMARQENPRLLEIQLNTLLSPKNRVKYFEE